VETHVASLCEELGNEIDFTILADKKKGLAADEKIGKARVVRVSPERNAQGIFEKFKDIALNELQREEARREFLESNDFDLLHIHAPVCFSNTVVTGSLFLPFYDLQFWTKARIPIVMTFHGLPEVVMNCRFENPLLSPYFNLWKTIEKWNINAAERTICVDEYAYKELLSRGISREKLTFILNGIDLKKFREIPREKALAVLEKKHGFTIQDGAKVFCFANRLTKDKGIEWLLRSCDELEGNYQILITGNGLYLDEVKKLCARNRKISYLGQIDDTDMPFLYSASDYCVNPTLNPGHLRTNMESIACNTPVLTSAVGNRFPVIGGKTGFLFDSRNSMTEVMQGIISGKAKTIKKLEENCEEAKRSYDIKLTAGYTKEVYEKAVVYFNKK
jgi:glycosyltransferase involved in cell wall biosynthesis